MTKKQWWLGAAGAAMAFAVFPVTAQAQQVEDERDAPIATSEEIVVIGEIQYRDRSEETAPTLEYGLDYFQRFEPLTVGDALKRVPSVAFLSDVLESDGVRLRGLDPAYTQILINGEQVPGSGSSSGAFGNGADGAFFVDRIPAELIERVEVVRSSSANRSGDAVAGAINIVLRDSYSLDGGFVRGGVQYFQNSENWGEVLGGVWGGETLGGRLLVGLNMQDRHNPKDKFSARFPSPTGALENIEDQTDVRDGTDYAGNFSYIAEVGPGEFTLTGFFVQTERYENEDSIEYSNPASTPTTAGAIRIPARLLTLNDNNVEIEQQSWSLNGGYEFDWAAGETQIRIGYASFTNEEDEFENEVEYLRDAVAFPEADRFTADSTRVALDDAEFSVRLNHEVDLSDTVEIEFGVDFQNKERDSLIAEMPRWRTGSDGVAALPAGTTLTTATGAGLPTPIPVRAFSAIPGGDNTVERTRIDPYIQVEGETGPLDWEMGLRLETTETDITDRTVGGPVLNTSTEIPLPSLHLRYNLSENSRITGSVARTVRRPSFSFLSPALLEAELGDNDFIGNPLLEPETAWGIDIGYERRLGRTGVFGVNVFYREVGDLIELATVRDATGAVVEGSEGSGTFVYTAVNTGEGDVLGIEFDLSTPLTVFGLENTGVFVNYSWLDSDIRDEFGTRSFNSQAESIFNFGFIQDIPSTGTAFGATYREQGDASSRVVGEEVTTSYGADLEIFVEQQFGESFVLRFTGSNLLDASKDEVFNKFDTVGDQRSRSFAEYELETESAGPVFQIIGRFAF